ncbi:hypothetical protein KY335_05040 [Candidatus Woesearchaeota archaeon]|nr:hypothetical protein [Candidatus Woesearchaeota archaeon]
MLRHLSTKRNVEIDNHRSCKYQAVYENGHAVLMVVGKASEPPNSDAIAFREFSNAKVLTFQDGYMISLDEVQDGKIYAADLTLRHDPECIGELRMLRHLWLEENYEVFEQDEFIRKHRHRFQELLDAEEVELCHGLTYKVMSLTPGQQTIEELSKAIAVEQVPKFRAEIIEKLKLYAKNNYVRGPFDIVEKALSIRLLESLGEVEAAASARKLLFEIYGKIGMWYYLESKRMKLPEPEPFVKVQTGKKILDL